MKRWLKQWVRRALMAVTVPFPRRMPKDPQEAERRAKAAVRSRVLLKADALAYELRREDARFTRDVLKAMHELLGLQREPAQERVTK